jgi:hypothetical protein
MVFSKYTLMAGLALAAACSGMSGTQQGTADHWHAKVYRGTEGKVGDQKSVAHTSATKLSDERTRVSVTLPGLLPRGDYAWGVYEGSCTGNIVGAESSYPNLVPDANSQGAFTAMVDANFVPEGDYYVTIFRTGGQRTDILGCVPFEQGVGDDSEE